MSSEFSSSGILETWSALRLADDDPVKLGHLGALASLDADVLDWLIQEAAPRGLIARERGFKRITVPTDMIRSAGR